MHNIAILIFPDCSLLDFTGPLTAFATANRCLLHDFYDLRLMSEKGGMLRSNSGACFETQPLSNAAIDTLMVCGGEGTRDGIVSGTVHDYVRAAKNRVPRIASVCTGTFVLAAAGLLDGKRATTHWRKASLLQRLHPAIHVESDRIFVQDGQIWTSAGISAGIDLALALIEQDLGVEIARQVARELVVYHRRPGGQAQFSAMLELDGHSGRIRLALSYAREHLGGDLSVNKLAELANLSPRQFSRAFLAETGETPAKAVERLRVEAARASMENGEQSLAGIARAVGFSDPERMRRAFLRILGQPPQALRRQIRAPSIIPNS
jgi:transcriptional regulator GlxA family with amidase domain